jgi:hypothetical protein
MITSLRSVIHYWGSRKDKTLLVLQALGFAFCLTASSKLKQLAKGKTPTFVEVLSVRRDD